MASEKQQSQVIKVNIFGEPYSLKTDAPAAQVEEIVGMVDGKMQRLAAGKTGINSKKLAVWAALDLAAELYDVRQKYAKLKGEALKD